VDLCKNARTVLTQSDQIWHGNTRKNGLFLGSARSLSLSPALPLIGVKKEKVKEADLYIAPILKYLKFKALRYGSHGVTCKLHRTCLYLVSIHQMAHPRLRLWTS